MKAYPVILRRDADGIQELDLSPHPVLLSHEEYADSGQNEG
jgi:hypothetical protein